MVHPGEYGEPSGLAESEPPAVAVGVTFGEGAATLILVDLATAKLAFGNIHHVRADDEVSDISKDGWFSDGQLRWLRCPAGPCRHRTLAIAQST
jgi:hypothetical protein